MLRPLMRLVPYICYIQPQSRTNLRLTHDNVSGVVVINTKGKRNLPSLPQLAGTCLFAFESVSHRTCLLSCGLFSRFNYSELSSLQSTLLMQAGPSRKALAQDQVDFLFREFTTSPNRHHGTLHDLERGHPGSGELSSSCPSRRLSRPHRRRDHPARHSNARMGL